MDLDQRQVDVLVQKFGNIHDTAREMAKTNLEQLTRELNGPLDRSKCYIMYANQWRHGWQLTVKLFELNSVLQPEEIDISLTEGKIKFIDENDENILRQHLSLYLCCLKTSIRACSISKQT